MKFSLYAKHPDYLSNRPGTTLAGRALAPLPFDGRLLGADFALLRPPIGEFMALGGMMIGRDDIEPLARPFASVANFRRVLSLLWRHATDRLRHRRGTRLLMGNALAARLFYSLRQRKVPVWLNASLRELTTADGRVTGAVLSVDGETRRVTARRGGRAGDRRVRRQRRAAQRICPPAAQARRRLRGRARARAWRSRARPAPPSRTITRSRRSGRRCRRPDGSPAGAAPIRISRSTAPSPA